MEEKSEPNEVVLITGSWDLFFGRVHRDRLEGMRLLAALFCLSAPRVQNHQSDSVPGRPRCETASVPLRPINSGPVVHEAIIATVPIHLNKFNAVYGRRMG